MSLATSQLLRLHRHLGGLHAHIEPIVASMHGQAMRSRAARPLGSRKPTSRVEWAKDELISGLRDFFGQHLCAGANTFAHQSEQIGEIFGSGGSDFFLYPYRNPLGNRGLPTLIGDVKASGFDEVNTFGRIVSRLNAQFGLGIHESVREGWFWSQDPGFALALLAVMSATLGLVLRTGLLSLGICLSMGQAFLSKIYDVAWPGRLPASYPTLLPPTPQQVHLALTKEFQLLADDLHKKEEEDQKAQQIREIKNFAEIERLKRSAEKKGDKKDNFLSPEEFQREFAASSHRFDQIIAERNHLSEAIAENEQSDSGASLASDVDKIAYPWAEILRMPGARRRLLSCIPFTVMGQEVFMLPLMANITRATSYLYDPQKMEIVFRLRYPAQPEQWQTSKKNPVDANLRLIGNPQLYINMHTQPELNSTAVTMQFFFDPTGIYWP